MNRLSIIAVLMTMLCMAVARADEQKISSQLDVYANPQPFTYVHADGSTDRLEPVREFVIVFGSSKEEMAVAFKNPEQFLKALEGREAVQYVIAAPPAALKDITRLIELAKTGRLPIIHLAYQIKRSTGGAILLFPSGVIEVRLKTAQAADQLLQLTKELGLIELTTSQELPPTQKIFQLAGKSKYHFVFDVAQRIGKADFVESARPVAPMFERAPPAE